MKKLSLSLMLHVSLALMLALSLIYPQSVAVSFVATGWIFTALIYLVASLFFRLIRKACRQRLEGRELCQS